MIKKIYTPIVYLLITISGVIFTLGFWDLLSIFGFQMFWGKKGVIIATISFLIIMIATLYLGNLLVQKIDHIKNISFKKHIWQSLPLYVVFIYEISQKSSRLKYLSIDCNIDCDDFIKFGLIALTPLIAIIANGLYLLKNRKKKIT